MTAEQARWLADAVLLLHGLFVLFVVGTQALVMLGGWRGWCWVRHFGLRLAHLAAIAFVVVTSWLGVPCPLTTLESELRHTAGIAGYTHAFIIDWVARAIYYTAPPWVFTLIYTVFGLLVLSSWFFYPPQRKRL
jgi:hypothetical protein